MKHHSLTRPGCEIDFGDNIFAPIDPHEDPVGNWTQSGVLAQDADPFDFTRQVGLQEEEEISGSTMPHMAMDLSTLSDGFLPGAAEMDPHLQTVDPACLTLPTSTHSGLDVSSTTLHEAFRASASPSGSQGAHPPL